METLTLTPDFTRIDQITESKNLNGEEKNKYKRRP